MEFSRLYLNRLQGTPTVPDTVVVIDTLRSFTTAAVAFAQGARKLYPVENLTAAIGLRERMPDALLIGAVGGGDPVPGFDFGNSPSQLMTADLKGRTLIMSTAAGVRGLQRFHAARHLFATSLVCARATAAAIKNLNAKSVCFIITGEWVDRDGDEDVACADYIEALLRGREPDPSEYAERVRFSDFGRRFTAGTWPNLPLADLELAEQVDRYDFALTVTRRDGYLVIL